MKYERTQLRLIPYPHKVEASKDKYPFNLEVKGIDGEFKTEIGAFADALRKIRQADIVEGENGIVISKERGLPTGGYKLHINKTIQIEVSDGTGLGYAFATLLQLIEQGKDSLLVVGADIEDAPDKGYRGLMVDLARKYHPFHTLKSYVDLCYFYKLNRLQLHFMDDQSYTLPTDIHPALNGSAAWHYSKSQLKELDEYAYQHGVMIVPEIEIPGHASFIVANTEGMIGGETHRSTMCIGKEKTEWVMNKMIDDVCELFPHAEYIHVGGDEVNTDEWEECPDCTRYREEHAIKTCEELYTYIVGKASQMVLDRGRKPIVWEGFSKEGAHYIPKETVVSVFENLYHLPTDLLEEGYQIINTSWKPLYITPGLSWPAVDIIQWDLSKFGNWLSLSPAYPDPIVVNSTENVKGALLCSWENDYEHELPVIMNNLPAVSQRLWTLEDKYGTLEFQTCFRSVSKIADRLIK